MDSGADTDAAGDGGHADGVSSIFSSMQARHTPLHSPVLSYFYPLSLLLFVSHYVTLIPSYLSPALSSMHHSYSQLILPPASIPAPLSKADNRFICHVQVSWYRSQRRHLSHRPYYITSIAWLYIPSSSHYLLSPPLDPLPRPKAFLPLIFDTPYRGPPLPFGLGPASDTPRLASGLWRPAHN